MFSQASVILFTGQGRAWGGGGAGGMGDVHGKGACMGGGGVGGCVRGRRDGHCNGRYASYWNAF